ncbi:MAG: hypothetical protein ABFS03_03980 [Chloroflexota bacterium]
MTKTHQDFTEKDALRWFIERFIHSERARIFARRDHGLEEMTVPQQQVQRNNSKRDRYAKYCFATVYQPASRKGSKLHEIPALHLIPARPASSWLSGMIIAADGAYRFISAPQSTMFDKLDEPR